MQSNVRGREQTLKSILGYSNGLSNGRDVGRRWPIHGRQRTPGGGLRRRASGVLGRGASGGLRGLVGGGIVKPRNLGTEVNPLRH